jgi:hypothetical protein
MIRRVQFDFDLNGFACNKSAKRTIKRKLKKWMRECKDPLPSKGLRWKIAGERLEPDLVWISLTLDGDRLHWVGFESGTTIAKATDQALALLSQDAQSRPRWDQWLWGRVPAVG